MREIITICEAISSQPEMTQEPLFESVRSVLSYLRFNGEDVSEWDARNALDAVDHLRRGIHTVYRHMRLGPDAISALDVGASLGLYWSEKEEVPRENLMDDPNSGEWAVLTARVSAKSVNVAETAGARLLNRIETGWEDEAEIRLRRGALITLLAIRNDAGQALRPDLAGRAFIA